VLSDGLLKYGSLTKKGSQAISPAPFYNTSTSYLITSNQ